MDVSRHAGLEPAFSSRGLVRSCAALRQCHCRFKAALFILHLFTSSCAFRFLQNVVIISIRICQSQALTTHLETISVILKIEG